MSKSFRFHSVFVLFFLFFSSALIAQEYWQQKVEYKMDIDFDVSTHQFVGIQELTYFNNSPDTLKRVYYHLYFNAFQPGSMMDVRSQNIPDPDKRIKDRISNLSESEIGYHKIRTLLQDGQPTNYIVEGTVLEVDLATPIIPGSKSTFYMEFDSQVPIQIRRSGRDNKEGISYSMTQWFPKMAEYDENGWYAYPYVAREFYAPWGNYEVNITIDKDFIVGASGVLQNPDEIGYGYSNQNPDHSNKKQLTWRFKMENAHDFAWVADPDYVHVISEIENGPIVRMLYQPDSTTVLWEELPQYLSKIYEFANENFGEYPYPEFIIMQGGDAGMEYPMSTLITGNRSLGSLVGVVVHEWMHSWYQGVLANDELRYGWMDEGFTEWAESKVMMHVLGGKNSIINNYNGYYSIAKSGFEEPMSTHGDYFHTNYAYGVATYSKGAVTLNQLGYVIGDIELMKAIRLYFDTWKFRHPDVRDFIRIMERSSGLELDWYFHHWINTTNRIDYAVAAVRPDGEKTEIDLKRIGSMPMPIDLMVTKKDGTQEMIYIPLRVMRGEKKPENDLPRTIMPDWPWTHPSYSLTIDTPFNEIQSIEIDPSNRMADVNKQNNSFKPKS